MFGISQNCKTGCVLYYDHWQYNTSECPTVGFSGVLVTMGPVLTTYDSFSTPPAIWIRIWIPLVSVVWKTLYDKRGLKDPK